MNAMQHFEFTIPSGFLIMSAAQTSRGWWVYLKVLRSSGDGEFVGAPGLTIQEAIDAAHHALLERIAKFGPSRFSWKETPAVTQNAEDLGL